MTVLTETLTLANGDRIPTVGFGTWLLEDGDECYDAVADALRLGYRHVDTARAYGNEASVGRAVRDATAQREFETTMTAIGLDYLDLYLIHAPWPWQQMGADFREENRRVWKAMEEFLSSDRVKAIGVSN